MHCTALIVAAGKGRRCCADRPKQFLPLAGRPLLCWTVSAFEACAAIDAIVVVVSAEQHDDTQRLLAMHPCAKLHRLVVGGGERTTSVMAGLTGLPAETELVAIHDGARPLVSPELIGRVITAAQAHGAALPALPAHETVKQAESGWVTRTVPRSTIYLAQTPQVFAVPLIRRAYAAWQMQPTVPVTDDAQVVELLGENVAIVEGERPNIKVTVPEDLELAERLIAQRGVPWPRPGDMLDCGPSPAVATENQP